MKSFSLKALLASVLLVAIAIALLPTVRSVVTGIPIELRRQVDFCNEILGTTRGPEPERWMALLRKKIADDPTLLSRIKKVSRGPVSLAKMDDLTKTWFGVWGEYFRAPDRYRYYSLTSNLVSDQIAPYDQFVFLFEGDEFIDVQRMPLVPW